jgi:myo-inositol-1(or 4)-monophosphatase
MSINLTEVLEKVRDELHLVGKRILETPPGKIMRSGRDVTTNLDISAADHLRSFLSSLISGSVVVTEEDVHREDIRAAEAPLWIVDPIDGSGNILTRYPMFATSVALLMDGVTSLAVIHNPNNDETFHAILHEGAFLNRRAIFVSHTEKSSDALVSTGLPLTDAERSASIRLLGRLSPEFRDIRMGGSATLELAYVACGRIDCYFESKLAPWDIAAGELLVAEAGGVLLKAGQELLDGVLRVDVVAGNEALAKAWLQKISDANGWSINSAR